MASFLLSTTLLSMVGLIATIVMGFRADPAHAATHILIALGTVIVALFSQSMTMFFFIGTGKQMKEATNNAAEVLQRTRAQKSKVFPAAMWALGFVMVTFIMGGGVKTGKTPVWLHTSLAFATLVVFARAYWLELRAMEDNAALMEKYLTEE